MVVNIQKSAFLFLLPLLPAAAIRNSPGRPLYSGTFSARRARSRGEGLKGRRVLFFFFPLSSPCGKKDSLTSSFFFAGPCVFPRRAIDYRQPTILPFPLLLRAENTNSSWILFLDRGGLLSCRASRPKTPLLFLSPIRDRARGKPCPSVQLFPLREQHEKSITLLLKHCGCAARPLSKFLHRRREENVPSPFSCFPRTGRILLSLSRHRRRRENRRRLLFSLPPLLICARENRNRPSPLKVFSGRRIVEVPLFTHRSGRRLAMKRIGASSPLFLRISVGVRV